LSTSHPSVLRQVAAQSAMEVRLTLRRGESVLVAFLIPIGLLIFFGYVPLEVGSAGDRIQLLLPGVIALALMASGMVSLGIATAFERYYGVLKLLGGTPLSRLALLGGKLSAVGLIQLGQVLALLLVAGLLFDWRPVGDLPLIVLALTLGSATFSALGLLLAGLLRAEATLAAANGLYLVLLLLGDMVVPLSALPAWLATLARLLPAAALTQALRAGFGSAEAAAWPSLLVLGLWGVGCLLLARRTFQWE
jgi:ABC-2 type transport system permease protein